MFWCSELGGFSLKVLQCLVQPIALAKIASLEHSKDQIIVFSLCR